MLIPESKKEARLAALAHGRKIQADAEASRAALNSLEAEMMTRQGYSASEIERDMAVTEFNDRIERGYGKSNRVKRYQY